MTAPISVNNCSTECNFTLIALLIPYVVGRLTVRELRWYSVLQSPLTCNAIAVMIAGPWQSNWYTDKAERCGVVKQCVMLVGAGD